MTYQHDIMFDFFVLYLGVILLCQMIIIFIKCRTNITDPSDVLFTVIGWSELSSKRP